MKSVVWKIGAMLSFYLHLGLSAKLVGQFPVDTTITLIIHLVLFHHPLEQSTISSRHHPREYQFQYSICDSS